MGSGLEGKYILKDDKKLRYGYTTGSCAAAAAKAAAHMLLQDEAVEAVKIITPKGILLQLEIAESEKGEGWIRCGVRKDAGDDPDVTDGIMVFAVAERTEDPGVIIDGGTGVGRVTRPGLDQPPGAAAINHVPREMIVQSVREEMEQSGYQGGIRITIEIPKGEELAEKTFNPRLGIVGGLSVLGTSGIVEPMSENALKESIRIALRQQVLEGREVLLVSPGNYGRDYIKEHLHVDLELAVKCSNYIGDTIDMAADLGAKGILFVSHIGKFIKVSGGIMDTHSRNGDARMELLAAHGVRAGVQISVLQKVLSAASTEEALLFLQEAGALEAVMQEMMKRIAFYLEQRGHGRIECEAIVFSGKFGELGRTKKADEWLNLLKKELEE